ncbi:MAG: hypothetical protein ACREIA_05645 [Opitutaceae bacterium]
MDHPYFDLELARVRSQQFPAVPREAAAVCSDLKLPASEARRLFDDGLLSFDPKGAAKLTEAHDAELVFVGSLAAAGCSRRMLKQMLSGLVAPYAYDLRCLYYDFRTAQWRLFPFMDDPESAFFILLEHLDGAHEEHALRSVRNWIDEALDLTQSRNVLFAHLLRLDADRQLKAGETEAES